MKAVATAILQKKLNWTDSALRYHILNVTTEAVSHALQTQWLITEGVSTSQA